MPPSPVSSRFWSIVLLGGVIAGCSGSSVEVSDSSGSPSTDPGGSNAVDGGADAPGDWVDDLSAAPMANAPHPLLTPTYDGSGQAVEPTVVEFPSPWHGHRYWMAMSPYPGANDALENPSILVSDDGLTWAVPTGLTNPLVTVPAGQPGHLDDATLFYDRASDDLWIYYLYDVKTNASNQETLLRMRSHDGVRWTPPETILTGPEYPFVSPSLAKVGDTFYLWTIEVPDTGCFSSATTVVQRTSADGVDWTTPLVVPMAPPGYVVWHLNTIAATPHAGFMSVLSAFPARTNCRSTRLYLGYGTGDDDWHVAPRPLLAPGNGWDSSEIYRASLLYDDAHDRLRVWYSARRVDTQEWHVGYTSARLPMSP